MGTFSQRASAKKALISRAYAKSRPQITGNFGLAGAGATAEGAATRVTLTGSGFSSNASPVMKSTAKQMGYTAIQMKFMKTLIDTS